MHVAYILNSYPQPSHSFIRREIRALEAQGHTVTRLAMRAGDAPLVDTQDVEEAAATTYVLRAGALTLLMAVVRSFLAEPARFLSALRLAVSCGRRSEVGLIKHLIYLVEAAYVTQYCTAAHATHAHAHFGTNAATVAMLSAALGGPAYSFTVHAPKNMMPPAPCRLAKKSRVPNSPWPSPALAAASSAAGPAPTTGIRSRWCIAALTLPAFPNRCRCRTARPALSPLAALLNKKVNCLPSTPWLIWSAPSPKPI